MRLAFYFENYVMGGGSKYVKDCLDCVLRSGHEVVMLSNQGALSASEISQLPGSMQFKTVHVFERTESIARFVGYVPFLALLRKALYVFNPLLFVANLLEVSRRLGYGNFDILVACNGGYPGSEPTLASVLAARLRRIPSLLIIMSVPRPRRGILPGYEALLDKVVLRFADTIVVNSEAQARMLISLRGALPSQIHILYNGIRDIGPKMRRRRPTKSEAVIGVVCRLDPMKGLDYLIHALSLLPSGVSLRIIGEGESRVALQNLAMSHGVGQRVDFLGFKSEIEVVNELDTLDIFVLPSLVEGLPYGVLEAMRAGLPIVSTEVGGIPEAVRDGKEALLVTPRSSHALADAITTLLLDPERAARLGAAARSRYEEIFSLRRMHESFAKIIDRISSQGAE